MTRVAEQVKRGTLGCWMLRHDPEILIAIGLICGVAVFALSRIGDYGITTDEWNADAYGAKAIAWYRSGFTDRAMFTDVENTLWYYGPWFHMLTSAVQSLDLGEHWDVRHAMTFLCGLGGIALLLPIGRLAIGRWAGLMGIVLCLTTGYLYGSLFFTPIDVPFLFVMTAAVLGIMLMASRPVPSWSATICAGLLTGLAIDDVEQGDDIERAEPGHRGLVRDAGMHIESDRTAMGGGVLGEFDAAHLVEGLCLLQKEPVGAANIEQPPGRYVSADEGDRAGEFLPQNRFGAEIIGVAVTVAAIEVLGRVVVGGLEAARLSTAEAARDALPDRIAVDGEAVANGLLSAADRAHSSVRGQLHPASHFITRHLKAAN